MSEPLTPEEAIEKLASRLYWYTEKLDPTAPYGEGWDDLSDDDRRFYRLLVSDLVCFSEWIEVARQRGRIDEEIRADP